MFLWYVNFDQVIERASCSYIELMAVLVAAAIGRMRMAAAASTLYKWQYQSTNILG